MRRRVLGVLVATAIGCLMAAATGHAGGNAGQHTGIAITSDHDVTSCTCVTSGDGTPGHPYIIGLWAITGPKAGSAVAVSGTIHSYFVITGISATGRRPTARGARKVHTGYYTGFYFDPRTSMRYPFSAVERPIGPANNFSNICYGTTDASGLPQSTCMS